MKRLTREIAQKSSAHYRWCGKEAQYIALAVCKPREPTTKQCRTCLFLWRQLPLPFPEQTGKKRTAEK
ncbi:MAG: hypothetical protein NTV89_10595 [Proteobacteria bacterium]|nr:hypothetical protein [Pseudomonadota bacterium]